MNTANTTDTSHYDKCLTILNNHKKSHMIRGFILFLLSIMNGYFHIITLPITKGMETTPDSSYARNAIYTNGFTYAVLAFLCAVAVLVLGFLFRQEKPKLILIPFVITILCTITGLFNLLIGIGMTVLLGVGLYESKAAVWLTEQEGYPYFNERFAEQQEISLRGFESRYDFKNIDENAEMPELEAGDHDPINQIRREAAVPGDIAPLEPIAPVTEVPAAQEQETRIPDPAETPDPVWDIPDPVMDTSVVTSSFPEVAGTIADLPEVPDIPKI